MNEMKTIWDFVIAHYPGYYNSDEIAYEGDLDKLLNDDYSQGDSADKLLQKEYDGEITDPNIEIDHDKVYMKILERAIQGYIDQLNEHI